jgi:hypothetical protein
LQEKKTEETGIINQRSKTTAKSSSHVIYPNDNGFNAFMLVITFSKLIIYALYAIQTGIFIDKEDYQPASKSFVFEKYWLMISMAFLNVLQITEMVLSSRVAFVNDKGHLVTEIKAIKANFLKKLFPFLFFPILPLWIPYFIYMDDILQLKYNHSIYLQMLVTAIFSTPWIFDSLTTRYFHLSRQEQASSAVLR